MGRKHKIKISRLPDSDEFAAYRPSSPKNKTKDFSTGYHTTTEKEKQKIQAESSQGHFASDSNPSSKGQTSNKERRDETLHAESELPNASGGEMDLRMEQNIYDKLKKFHQERYEAALLEAVIYGEQERGSSNEISPASQGEASSKIASRKNQRQSRVEESQGLLDQKKEEKLVASQDVRGKSQSQDSSVPDVPVDRLHLLEERVQKLEEDARNKKELFFHTQEECKSIIKDITRLKKERATLKKEYKPLTTKMQKLESKIEEQEQKKRELTLQLNKVIDDYTVNIIETIHMTDQRELLKESIIEEYNLKKSILERLENEIEKKQMQKANFMRKLDEITKAQDNIARIKEYEIQQRIMLDNKKWMGTLEKVKDELLAERKTTSESLKILRQNFGLSNSLLSGLVNPYSHFNRRDFQNPAQAKNPYYARGMFLVKYSDKVCRRFEPLIKSREDMFKNINERIKATVTQIVATHKKLEEENVYNQIIDRKTMNIEENNIDKDNTIFYEETGKNQLIHFEEKLDLIRFYDDNDIKGIESKYKTLQNDMRFIEEMKEANRILEQNISQCQFNHGLYEKERQYIIRHNNLAKKVLFQGKEINIQNPKLSQDKHREALDSMVKVFNEETEILRYDIEKAQIEKYEAEKNIFEGLKKEIFGQLSNYDERQVNIRELSELVSTEPFNRKEAERKMEDLYTSLNQIENSLKSKAEKYLEKRDKVYKHELEALKTDQEKCASLLKKIEDYQLAKSNLEKEIDAKLKIIESQFKTDLRHLQHVHNEKKSELERLRSEREDFEKNMQPEAQQRELQEQFNIQVNKIKRQVNTIDKKLEVDHEIIKETKNEFDSYNQKRELLTRQIKDQQDKLKKEKKKLDIADAEWLKARIAVEEARSSLESSIIERTRNSMERSKVRKTSRKKGSIAQGLQGDTKDRTNEHLNDYGIINAYNRDIKTQHEELDKLNRGLINLYDRQKILKRRIIQNKIKIESIYKYKNELHNKHFEQLAILNNRKEEYTAMKQVFNKLDEEYHDCLQTCEAVGNVITILNSEISAEKEGQQKLTLPTDEINTKPEQLNALDSQSHTLRQQNAVSAQEVKDLLEKELAAAEQKKMELKEKVEKSRKDLEEKKTQLKLAGNEWLETGKNISKARHSIVIALAEKFELRRHLAKVKNDIELIESNKFYNKIESNKIIKNIEKLLEKDNPTVSGSGQEENNKPSKPKSILKKSLESQEDQGKQVKQVKFIDSETNTSQTAFEKLKDPLQAQEQSSSELASRDALTVQQHAEVDRQIKALGDQIIQTNDKEIKLMMKAKTSVMRDRAWRAPLPKRPWDGAAEEKQE